MISSWVTRLSTLLLVAGGLPLLFASDVILPRLIEGIPPSAAWLGQLVAAAWLSVALHNWNARSTVMGGIYGRPLLNLNLVLHVMSALALLKSPKPYPGVFAIVFALMALAYAILLFRGPFDRAK